MVARRCLALIESSSPHSIPHHKNDGRRKKKRREGKKKFTSVGPGCHVFHTFLPSFLPSFFFAPVWPARPKRAPVQSPRRIPAAPISASLVIAGPFSRQLAYSGVLVVAAACAPPLPPTSLRTLISCELNPAIALEKSAEILSVCKCRWIRVLVVGVRLDSARHSQPSPAQSSPVQAQFSPPALTR